ncbi:cell division protein FtsK [Terrabacter tumescens]|uniref:Cell division protein FtsK n=1 Tax=Terrabacter tumescens TaxID=60443 RepID=A0ABQ2IC20_9MICO|nr:FtsK/SpoIIIE domain-containing protein [Terrabacter tumescens]GGN03862.1 cell division protein FtsK [Terrabacter tumescens]
MQLTMTVIDTRRPSAPRHVLVEAASGTRFEDVRSQLSELVGVPGCAFRTEGRPVMGSDVLGAPPLLRGVLLTVACPDDPPPTGAGRGAVELRVVGGVGAGRAVRLGRGEHVLGRAASADVRLDDPGVSRSHAVVAVTSEGITVRDLEPTNRSRLDGVELPCEGAPLRPGQHLTVASTTLVLGSPDVRAGYHEVRDGEVHIHRQPRFRDRTTTQVVSFPEAPSRPDRHRMPLLASIAPVVVSAGLALALSSPTLLLFALLSPVMLLGQWWSDRRAGRTSYRRLVRDHATALESARCDLARAAVADAARRHDAQPDLSRLEAVVRHRGTRLWERRPEDDDHLVLRVGTATQDADVQVEGPAPDGLPRVERLPALVDLATSGIAGIAGRRDHTISVAGALVAQAVTWHTPRRLGLHVLTDSEHHVADWAWTTHLPHARDDRASGAHVVGGAAAVTRNVAALRTLVDSRLVAAEAPSGRTSRPSPDLLVVLDGASAMRALPGVAELLTDGPRAGVAFICTDRDITSLPAETRVSLDIGESGEEAILREDGHTVPDVVPDLPAPGWLEAVSRAMAPFVDATPETGQAAVPREVSFVDLHRDAGVEPSTADGLVESWTRSTARPVALLGRTSDGHLTLDLSADGPHVLVGGTTGSGKSELLQALVTGLAVSNRPDELGLVLVDYKGGSAFSDCARLPHTVGLVTDLDAHLTARALTSLDAEMKRRERLFARASARDLDGYRAAASVCRELPPLARLVIVVDEFKALADEFPDFITGLVRVAALGRSLGLHLVLATQRPAGIVSADMRANVACRIALRVRDRADSEDVVDSADAASLDPRAPGRACLRRGDGGLTTVQTAYLGRPLPDPPGVAGAPGAADASRVVVHDLSLPLPGPTDEAGHGATARPTELEAVVAAARAAARVLGIDASTPPWLPPLPNAVAATDLRAVAIGDGVPLEVDGVPLGVVDVPTHQRRELFCWSDGERGHLGIAGGPRSGRSTALLTLALGLAASSVAQDLHVHVLQGAAGPCAALAPLPHVGTVTDGADPEPARRLISRLLRLVDGDETGPARTVVLVDGWESLEESLSRIDHGTPVDDLHRLLRDGPAAGVRFAVTGGRAILSGRLPGLLERRLVLHMPDPLDLTLAGIAPALAATARPPGRAIDLLSGHELQLALAGDDPQAPIAEVVARAAESGLAAHAGPGPSRPAQQSRPWRITALPERVGHDVLPTGCPGVWLGLGGDDAAPTELRVGRGHGRVLVAGPHRSGRSSTLATIAEGLVSQGRHVVLVAPRRSILSAWATARECLELTQLDADDLIAARRADPDLCVVVDDAELVDGSPVERALVDLARLVDDTDGAIVVAAELTRANGAFRGLVPEIARDGFGVLLGASTPADGDVLGVRLHPETVRRPGRGHLIVDGHATPVQVALLDPRHVSPALPVRGDSERREAC